MREQPFIRPLNPAAEGEIDLVAERMRLTLIEAVGFEKGSGMYSMEWLRARVRWHLTPEQVKGQVFLVEVAGRIAGHTIVRIEVDADGARTGLFATTYVDAGSRRQRLAEALLRRGEEWLAAHDVVAFATNTAEGNAPLIKLFEKHEYQIVRHVPEIRMVRLSKACARCFPS
jgi:GNAT superfamily N-acetyltransferase